MPNFKITVAGLINFVFLGKASKVPLIAKGTIGDPDLKDTVSGSNIEANSKKFKSATKTAIGYESIVIA